MKNTEKKIRKESKNVCYFTYSYLNVPISEWIEDEPAEISGQKV
jgi:hypothetical protein